MGANVELDVPESEQGGDCVCASLAVLARSQEEEEGNPGKVKNGLLVLGAALCCGIQGVEDGDRQWADSLGRRIFSLVGRELSAQEKVDGSHSIKLRVWGPQGRKYLAHRVDVLIHASFLNGLFLDRKDACAYPVS